MKFKIKGQEVEQEPTITVELVCANNGWLNLLLSLPGLGLGINAVAISPKGVLHVDSPIMLSQVGLTFAEPAPTFNSRRVGELETALGVRGSVSWAGMIELVERNRKVLATFEARLHGLQLRHPQHLMVQELVDILAEGSLND